MRLRRRSGSGDETGSGLVPGLDPADPADPAVPDTDPDDHGSDRAAARAARTPLNRTVWVVAVVAIVALGAGILLSRFVISPAQAAAEAEPPEAGLITVPVELRTLSSDVVARGDARYDDPVSVTLETSDLGGPAVVTGAVPEVGAQLDAGSIALEVAGRPVIVLPGELPVYRTLRAGASGPDVVQLRDALHALGIDAGTSETYDATMAAAVQALYARVGYPAPAAPEGTQETLDAAEEAVTSAESALRAAESEITTAGKGASQADRIRFDNAVNQAQRDLDDAKACAAAPAPTDPETGATLPKDPCATTVAAADDALRLARQERTDGTAAPDTSAQVAARDAASKQLEDARTAREAARGEVMTPLPAGEVLFVASLPRRVDSVEVKRGSTVTGAVMTVSGATLEIEASLDRADADLLTVSQAAELLLDDAPVAATVAEIGAAASSGEGSGEGGGEGSGGSGRVAVVLQPTELTEEQRTALAGSNVRIRIPVSSTAGEVLAVPVAALTAGPGGETRIEVLRDGEEEPELVVVQTGLSAQGYAEVTSSEAPLEAGDQVVVGQ